MKYIAIACMALLVLAGCNNRKANTEPGDSELAPFVEEYDAESYEDEYEDNRYDPEIEGRLDIDSLGYYGVYEGATFTGGKTLTTTLTLYDNNRYKIHAVDLGDNARTEEEQGTYLVFGDLLTLTPDNNGNKQYFRTGDNHVIQLDENQKEIPTQHSQNFRLIRK